MQMPLTFCILFCPLRVFIPPPPPPQNSFCICFFIYNTHDYTFCPCATDRQVMSFIKISTIRSFQEPELTACVHCTALFLLEYQKKFPGSLYENEYVRYLECRRPRRGRRGTIWDSGRGSEPEAGIRAHRSPLRRQGMYI
jgi:hypothetical protein